MAQSKNLKLLSLSLIIYIIVVLVYGIFYLLAPQVLVEAQGGEPVASGWLRWSGGVLVALGAGAVLVYRNPVRQDAFVVTITLGCLLSGLALLYALLIELNGKAWFTVLPMVVLFILTGLLWFAKKKKTKNNNATNIFIFLWLIGVSHLAFYSTFPKVRFKN